MAAAAENSPKPSEICKDGLVEPARLVDWYIKSSDVDLNFVQVRSQTVVVADRYAALTPAQRLLSDHSVCDRKDGVRHAACGDYNDALGRLFAFIDAVSDGSMTSQYTADGGGVINDRAFVRGEGAKIACVTMPAATVQSANVRAAAAGALAVVAADPAAKGSVPSAAGGAVSAKDADKGKETFTFPLLVRGSPDGMYLTEDSQRDEPAYKALPKASLSSSWDGSTGKTQNKTVLFLGKTIFGRDDTYGNTKTPVVRAVLYGGIDKSVSIARDKTKTAGANTVQFGLSYGAYLYDRDPANCRVFCSLVSWVTARPDYLVDYADKNRLASLNLAWTPYVDSRINSFRPIVPNTTGIGRYSFTFQVVQDNGWYLRRGPVHEKDFNRVGVKPGLVIESQLESFPVTLTVNDALMYSLRGTPKHFDDTYADLSWPLDKQKYFAVELTYTNGRKEQTTAFDRTWNIALTAKY